MSSTIKNNPATYQSRSHIAGGARVVPLQQTETSDQKKQFEKAEIDKRWYIQFPIKSR
jgi:hypothetical protein